MFHQVKKFPELYRTPQFIVVVYTKQPAVAHILSQMNPIHKFLPYFSKILSPMLASFI